MMINPNLNKLSKVNWSTIEAISLLDEVDKPSKLLLDQHLWYNIVLSNLWFATNIEKESWNNTCNKKKIVFLNPMSFYFSLINSRNHYFIHLKKFKKKNKYVNAVISIKEGIQYASNDTTRICTFVIYSFLYH